MNGDDLATYVQSQMVKMFAFGCFIGFIAGGTVVTMALTVFRP